MKTAIETQRRELREQPAREVMRNGGHLSHPYDLQVISNELEQDTHDRLTVVWCISESCKKLSSRGTAVGPTRMCLLDRCTLCHPVTRWEKFVAMIKIALG